MESFDSKLSMLFKKYNVNIYKLSQNIAMDRSTIQHIKAGKRLPPRSFIDTVCMAIQATLTEKQELLEAYNISKTGAKSYFERLQMKELIEDAYLVDKYEHTCENGCTNFDLSDFKHSMLLHDKYTIFNIINYITDIELKKENPHLSLSVPFKVENIIDELYRKLVNTNKSVKIEHYLRLYSGKDGLTSTDNNITILRNALKFSLCVNPGSYTPYYFFIDKDATYDVLPAFPYYFMTTDHIMLFSSDCKSAWLLDDKEVMEDFLQHNKKVEAVSSVLIQSLTRMEYLMTMSEVDNSVAQITIDKQPCIERFFEPSYVESYLCENLPHRDEILQIGNAIFGQVSADNSKAREYRSYFTREGIEKLAMTGKLNCIAESMAKPFDVKDRISLLEKMRTNAESFGMIDSAKLNMSDDISIDLHSDRSVIISFFCKDTVRFCKVNDSSLCVPFFNFVKDDLCPEMLVSQDELLEEIDYCIKLCEGSTDFI